MQNVRKYSKNEVVEAIIKKFGSQKKCAEALGIDRASLSGLLKKPSEKTIIRLENLGVDFSGASNVNIKGEFGGIGLTSGNTKVYNSGNERVKELEAENKHLKEKVKLLEEMILILKESISNR